MVSTVYIARHGFRANWEPLPHAPAITGDESDPSLSVRGVSQARELAHYLLSIDPQPQLVVSSPFYRCVETGDAIAEVVGVPIVLESGLSEWYKPDRDRIPQPVGVAKMMGYFERVEDSWESTVVPSSRGETQDELFERCRRFWREFVPKFESRFPEVDTIVIVTHAAVKIALGMAIMGFGSVLDTLDNEDTRLRTGVCSLDKYELVDNKWKIQMNGNVEFLTQGEQMHWDFINSEDYMDKIAAYQNGQDERAASHTVSTTQPGAAGEPKQDDEEYIDVYTVLELPNNGLNSTMIPPMAKLQVSGLDMPQPLFKIDNGFYRGEWSKLVGTAVAVDDDLKQWFEVEHCIKLEDLTLG